MKVLNRMTNIEVPSILSDKAFIVTINNAIVIKMKPVFKWASNLICYIFKIMQEQKNYILHTIKTLLNLD